MKKKITITLILTLVISALSYSSYAQTPNAWNQKSSFVGMGRTGAVGFTIDSKGYLGTGYGSGETTKTDFWEFDPATDSWTQKADFGGSGRTYAVGFSIDSLGYIGTGLNVKDTVIGSALKDFWMYSPSLNTWAQKADFGGPERFGAVGISIGPKGYIGTGDNFDTSFMTSNDFWEYDPATDTWMQKATFIGAGRVSATGFAIGNKGYLGLGNIGVSRPTDFYEYDPVSDTWTEKASFGGLGRKGAFGCGTDTNGYVGVGLLSDKTYINDFWEYSPTADTWIKRANFQGSTRASAAGFSIDHQIYLGTGDNGLNYLGDFWEFNPGCVIASITSEPDSRSLTYGDSTSFTVSASDAVVYQWQEDAGSGFVDLTDGGIYSGVTTDTLSISLPTVDMTGYKYRCLVTGPCLPTVPSNGNASLTVMPFSVMITPDADQMKVYGSEDPLSFGYSFAPMLLGSDTVSGQMERIAGENVGEYSYSIGTLTAGINYSLSIATTPTFIITPASLTITADDKEKCADGSVYGDAFTVSYDGFLNGDDQSVLGNVLVFGGDAVTATDPGSYTISPSGQTAANYILSYLDGTLVINPVPIIPVITRNGFSLISSSDTGNQWYLDDVEIVGATDKEYTAVSNGIYYTVITENGCSSSSNSILILDVSLDALSASFFDVFPNPNNGKFNIKLKTANSKEIFKIEIYNSLGLLVWKNDNEKTDSSNNINIDLKGSKSGVYTIVIGSQTKKNVKKIFITK